MTMRPSSRLDGKPPGRRTMIAAGGLVFGLAMLSLATLVIYGVGIWEYLTTDVFPESRPSGRERTFGVVMLLLPIAWVPITWTLVSWVTRLAEAIPPRYEPEETTEGVTPSD